MDAQSVIEKLAGTWELLSYALIERDGTALYPMGEDSQGRIIYDRNGNMSVHLNSRERRTLSKAPAGMSEEMRISYEQYAGYYGTYRVNVAEAWIDHHLVGASLPDWVGSVLGRAYVLDGDSLTLSADIAHTGQRAVLKWRRIG